ncbi:type II restriction endonuclease [Helicobacter sp. MIT 99-5507]|uniref:type II restriction endonuclease n=1 Tax=Helicobacter sp. MIT 99-5507 TaxID=152489 RepID=UPI002162A70E|nr:type II restriction endonuclease [Helicobacter sp. MIT 99-5507]
MKNTLEFSHFLNTLKASNRRLSFFVDWEKCLKNVDKIRICLNHLNFLLGKDKDSIKTHTALLFDEYPKAFSVLHLLLAVRDSGSMVLDSSSAQCRLDSYFKNADSIFDFLCESGLIDIFARGYIKDLNDFVFGIEVGLDSNARKIAVVAPWRRIYRKSLKTTNLILKNR